MVTTRSRLAALAVLMFSLLGSGCGDDTVEPDPTVADFVGDWEASAMVFTNLANPSMTVDVIEIGASFFLNVQPSGAYTSSLAFQGSSATELGRIEVEGDRLIFRVEVAPTGPRIDTASYDLRGDRLELSGRTVFDFDLNGIGEPAGLEGTLHRQ